MPDYIRYILRFLLGNTPAADKALPLIGYTADKAQWPSCKVVILPCGLFDDENHGHPHSLPTLPLAHIDGTPLLYGLPEAVPLDGTLLIKADVIASAYFLLSRYEEYVRRDVRDAHGRFPGKQSLPARAGFMHRPVVDEYGRLLRKWLRSVRIDVPEPRPEINKVYLTVDVDVPFLYRSFKGLVRGLLFAADRPAILKTYWADKTGDPACTFPWIAAQNTALTQGEHAFAVEAVYFFKSKGRSPQDKPRYDLTSKDIQSLFSFCREQNITMGLHASYASGKRPTLIKAEKEHLEKATDTAIRYNRHHFLRSREPEDFSSLAACGITDDFTMGYADIAGFRLGTCRPVSWINPADKKVYPLTLHPLTVMDCTLTRETYMNLSFEEAFDYCRKLIRQTAMHHGDLTLLWHNHYLIPAPGNWEKELYQLLIETLRQ
jgi:hypothetical protein